MTSDQELGSIRREKNLTRQKNVEDGLSGRLKFFAASSERVNDPAERKEFDSEIKYDPIPGREVLHFQDGESLPLSQEALSRIEDTIAELEEHIKARYERQRASLDELHERVRRDLEKKEGSRL